MVIILSFVIWDINRVLLGSLVNYISGIWSGIFSKRFYINIYVVEYRGKIFKVNFSYVCIYEYMYVYYM